MTGCFLLLVFLNLVAFILPVKQNLNKNMLYVIATLICVFFIARKKDDVIFFFIGFFVRPVFFVVASSEIPFVFFTGNVAEKDDVIYFVYRLFRETGFFRYFFWRFFYRSFTGETKLKTKT